MKILQHHTGAKVITFIGPVGVGKSTQMMLTKDHLRLSGVRTITTYMKDGHILAHVLVKFLLILGAYEKVKYVDGVRIYPRRDILKKLFPLYRFLDSISIAVKFLCTISVPYALNFVILLEEGPIMTVHTYAEVLPKFYGTPPSLLAFVPNLAGWIEQRNHINIVLEAGEQELCQRRMKRSFRRSELSEYERLQRNWIKRLRWGKTVFIDTQGLSIGQVQERIAKTLSFDNTV